MGFSPGHRCRPRAQLRQGGSKLAVLGGVLAMVVLAGCVWTIRDGERVPTSVVTSFQGAGHCDWQSVTFLQLEDRQYLRDPEYRLVSETVERYDGDVELPEEAVDTGYRRGDDELWLSADGKIAYLVTADAIEAWPSTTEEVWCG